MRDKIHPAAEAFPMMNAEQYAGLKADMAERGQQEAIVYWQGQLVDGRNRLKACRELKLAPTECELDESTDPVAYVISANLHRRHLTTTQRSMVAAKFAMLKNGSNQHKKEGPPIGGPSRRDDAAKLLNVSIRSVDRAKQIVANGSKELVQAVELGDVKSLSQAVKLIKNVPDKTEQTKIVLEGKDAINAATASKPVEQKSKARSNDSVESAVSDESDEFDYPIVKAFEHCDYRLNTLKLIFNTLSVTEREVVKEWLTTPTTN